MGDKPSAESTATVTDPGERMDRFVAERLAVLSGKLPPDGVPLDGSLVDEVRVLEGLSHLRRDHLRQPPRKRTYVVRAIFVLTAALVTALVFIPLRPLQAEMDIVCSGVTLKTSTEVQITGLTSLKRLEAIQFAPTTVEDSIELQSTFDVRPRGNGSVTLSSITVPPGARLSIEKLEDAGSWRLGIEHEKAQAVVTLARAIELSLPGKILEQDFGMSGRIDLRPEGNPPRLQVDLTPANETLLVRHNIPVTELKFEEAIAEGTSDNVGVMRGRTSSVIKGTIFNESLGGRQVALRTRETVDVDLESGQVREVRLESDGIHLNVSASARTLRAGTAGALKTLNPSYLEWLAEHHALKLAWGAAAWLFALIIGGMRWWQAADVR